MNNSQKTPIVTALPGAIRRQIDYAMELVGETLPASVVEVMGSIVKVKFEVTSVNTLPQVTVPLIGSEYIRLPIQAGCKGVVRACDASIGGMSGLGLGTADLSNPGNLSALVFEPIGNNGWTAPESADALEMYGEDDGVWIKNKQNKDWYARWTSNGITLTNTGGTVAIIMTSAGIEVKGVVTFDDAVIMNAALKLAGAIQSASGGQYSQNISTSGTVTASDVISGLIHLLTHKHLGVTTGGGTSGLPTA